MAEDLFEITMDLVDGYKFRVDFHEEEGVAPLILDEPPPLGSGEGPNAARLLAAAVGNCLSASALYCLRKARIGVHGMRTHVQATVERNDRGRLRIGAIKVQLEPEVDEEDAERMDRCLDIFEDFCLVTASVRSGIEAETEVRPRVLSAAAA